MVAARSSFFKNRIRAQRQVVRQQFGVVGERMVLELQGTSCLELEEVQPRRSRRASSAP